MTDVFLSYSWDSESHQMQVAAFVNFLRENGFNATMDLQLAEQETAISFTKMMLEGIQKSKKVIIILSKGYKEKADNFKGGAGSEYLLLMNDIQSNPTKYVLFSFEGIRQEIIPFGLAGRYLIDNTAPHWEQELFAKLLDENRFEFSSIADKKPQIQKIIFPNSFTSSQKTVRHRSNAQKIKASISMEKKVKRDLVDHAWTNKQQGWGGAYPGTSYTLISSRAIIRSVDDTHYPMVDDNPVGPMSSWVREQLYDLTSEGIEIWVGASMGCEIIMDSDGSWEIIGYHDERKTDPNFYCARIMIIGLIPYYNIVDYKKKDEYYLDPHIFCHFEFDGTPYSKTRYKVDYGEERELPTYDLDIFKKR